MHVAGDRNLTGIDGQNCESAQLVGIATLLEQSTARWQGNIHNDSGNMLMGDSSVQQLSMGGLKRHLSSSGDPNQFNHILKP